MADLATLTALREQVVAAMGPDREIDTELAYALCELDTKRGMPVFEGSLGVPPFTSSIDAALALVERMLPGWSALILQDAMTALFDKYGTYPPLEAIPPAVLAALLSALIEKENADG